MERVRGIAEFKSYGKVRITVSKLMDKYGISLYQMAKLTNLKYTTIKSYYCNAPITRVDLDVIAKMCYVLDCNIQDILEYTKTE